MLQETGSGASEMTPGIFLVMGIFLIPCEHRVKNPGMPSTCRHLLGCREQRELRTGAGLGVTHLGTCTEPRPAPGRVCPCSPGWALLLPWHRTAPGQPHCLCHSSSRQKIPIFVTKERKGPFWLLSCFSIYLFIFWLGVRRENKHFAGSDCGLLYQPAVRGTLK